MAAATRGRLLLIGVIASVFVCPSQAHLRKAASVTEGVLAVAKPNGPMLMNLTRMLETGLPEQSRHVNNETVTADWFHEYPPYDGNPLLTKTDEEEEEVAAPAVSTPKPVIASGTTRRVPKATPHAPFPVAWSATQKAAQSAAGAPVPAVAALFAVVAVALGRL
mmetsp:Transcript_93687/g.201018  ORF Transcript_93687/g.201018 Transcript_93687/m.201018 type:complete len:164 (-) Transcript_93687:75-566(-)